jgi:hypothetical protein
MPQMSAVQVPALVDDLHRQLERRATANVAVADELHTVGFDGIGRDSWRGQKTCFEGRQ